MRYGGLFFTQSFFTPMNDTYTRSCLTNFAEIWNFPKSVHERDKCQGMT
jgi:hypothetical protein